MSQTEKEPIVEQEEQKEPEVQEEEQMVEVDLTGVGHHIVELESCGPVDVYVQGDLETGKSQSLWYSCDFSVSPSPIGLDFGLGLDNNP